jgi:hypothetical protein
MRMMKKNKEYFCGLIELGPSEGNLLVEGYLLFLIE